MEKYRLVMLIFILHLTLIASLSFIPVHATTTNTILSIEPQQIYMYTLEPLTINVTISNVTNLSAWQLKISFNPSILKCLNVSVPEQNIFQNRETTGLSVKIDNSAGYVMAFNGLWEAGGVNGSGIVCQITFKALDAGISSIVFVDTMEVGGTYITDQSNSLIPFKALNSYVQIRPPGYEVYDFEAVKSGKAYTVILLTNSTASNFKFNETLQEMSFQLNGTEGTIGSCTASIPRELLNGTFAILINGYSTYFTKSSDELNTYLRFTYAHSTLNVKIMITLPGDLNGDRKIDMRDIAIAAKAFGTTPSDIRWNPIADLNKDLKVDMKDIAIVAKSFGKTWQY